MALSELFTQIADAIRAKNNTTEKIIASDFPTEIQNMDFTLQEKSITPSEEVQVVVPDDGIYGLSKVTVGAVDLQELISDATVTAEDILEGCVAYGINGKVIGTIPKNIDISITPSENEQNIPTGYVSGVVKSISDTEYYKNCNELASEMFNMPSENYIYGTGAQYIDTNIIPDDETVIEIRFKQDSDNVYYERLFGGQGSFNIQRGGTNKSSWQFYLNGTWITPNNFTMTNEEEHVLKVGNGKLILDGNEIKTYTTKISSDAKSIHLFTDGTSRGADSIGSFYLYEFSVYKSNELVMHLTPMIDKNDVVCLYDDVSNKLFYNMGTGTFEAGAGVQPADLSGKLSRILLEKAQKILAENIKAGVTIFGVTGTYAGE